jgi:hypothetical protein
MNYNTKKQSINLTNIKKRVIKLRTSGKARHWDILAKAIVAYESSVITSDRLWSIYLQIKW